MKTLHWNCGDGRWSLEAGAVLTGQGLVVYLGGGETHHVGCVVLAEPRLSLSGDGSPSCTISLLNRLGHRDDVFAQELARRLCVCTGQPVSVTAGVHVEDAAWEDLGRLKANFATLCRRMEADLS